VTKAQARQRVWKVVRASLEFDLKSPHEVPWLERSPLPNRLPLNKKDRERIREAAEEILEEIRVFESKL
jgi:hypothetical protein